jgi:CRP-like cAMP-binding protein
LRRGRWFAGLNEDVQARIEAGGRVRNVRRGDVFIKQGDEPVGLIACIDGQIRAQTTAPSGKTALVTVFHPGDFFSFLGAADGRPHVLDYVASVESVIFVLPYQVTREIFATDQQLFLYLVGPQLIAMRKTIDYMTTTIRLSPIQRLAERLLDFSRSPYYPEGDHRPLLGLSQELLASAVLCTRQTTNELLGELQSRSLIKSEYGRIEILDPDGLRKIYAPPS